MMLHASCFMLVSNIEENKTIKVLSNPAAANGAS